MKANQRESTETAAVAKGCAGNAAATLKEAPQAVDAKDLEPSEVLHRHRPSRAAVEQE